MSLNYCFFVKQISTLAICFLVTTGYLYAQNLSQKKPKDFEYKMGKQIGGLLTESEKHRYSVSFAEIKKKQVVDIGKATYDKVTFSVIKHYISANLKDKDEKEFTVNLIRLDPRKRIGGNLLWFNYVDKSPGTKVVIFHRKLRNGVTISEFLSSDVNYFDDIRYAIDLFGSFKVNENKLINYFANEFDEDTDVNKAIAIRYLVKQSYKDISAHVISKMLEDSVLGNNREMSFLLSRLGSILSSQSTESLPELRAKNFERVVSIASREDKTGLEATWILIGVARFNSDELRKYLKPETNPKILYNLQTITQNRIRLDEGESLRNLLY